VNDVDNIMMSLMSLLYISVRTLLNSWSFSLTFISFFGYKLMIVDNCYKVKGETKSKLLTKKNRSSV